MAKTKQTTLKLKNFTNRISQTMTKSESVTSHIFTSFLYDLTNTKPYELLPQISSTKGQIDYYILPENKTNLTFYVELKSYGKLNDIKPDLKQINKYLKGNPSATLNSLDRTDTWRVGILTDLRVLVFLLRRRDWGNSSRIFELPVEKFDLTKIEELFAKIDKFLSSKVDEITRIFFWDNLDNRKKVIFDELKLKNKSNLYKRLYSFWINSVANSEKNYKGGKGWPQKFEKCYSALLGFTKQNFSAEIEFHLTALNKAFNEKEIRELTYILFKSKYSVSFGKGNIQKVL